MRGCRDGVLPVGCRAAWWLPGCQAWRSPRWRADDFSLLFYFYHILICRCRRCFNCTCCCYCSRHKSLLPSQQGIHSSGLVSLPLPPFPSFLHSPSLLLAFISIFLPRESISCETSPHVCYFVCMCVCVCDFGWFHHIHIAYSNKKSTHCHYIRPEGGDFNCAYLRNSLWIKISIMNKTNVLQIKIKKYFWNNVSIRIYYGTLEKAVQHLSMSYCFIHRTLLLPLHWIQSPIPRELVKENRAKVKLAKVELDMGQEKKRVSQSVLGCGRV